MNIPGSMKDVLICLDPESDKNTAEFSEECQGEKLCISILGQILYLFIGLDPVLYFVRSFTRPVER